MKRARSFFSESKGSLKDIFQKFKKRDFTGNTGQVMKNSTYRLGTNMVAKAGSLIFTAIIARILLPELFGLYSLALGTIIFFSAFSDLGIDSAVITFVAKSLGKKNPRKAKAYFSSLVRIKAIATIIVSLALIASAYVLARGYYHKPIFLGLLAGGLYLPFANFAKFFEAVYLANNNFKYPLLSEITFQVSRILIIPIALFFLMKNSASSEIIVFSLIALAGISYLLSVAFLFISSGSKLLFLQSEEKKITLQEKERLKKFIFPLTLTLLSGIFFGYIDTFMLGRFVSGEYLGYYGSAFSLISSAMILMGFAATATFPIFLRIKGGRLQKALKRVLLVTFLISFLGTLFTFFTAKYVLLIVYGEAFLPATIYLQYFSILLMVGTLTGVFTTYFVSQEKTRFMAKALIGTTILNIVLNYVLITKGLSIGMREAVLGACIATITSKIVLLAMFGIHKR